MLCGQVTLGTNKLSGDKPITRVLGQIFSIFFLARIVGCILTPYHLGMISSDVYHEDILYRQTDKRVYIYRYMAAQLFRVCNSQFRDMAILVKLALKQKLSRAKVIVLIRFSPLHIILVNV